METDISIIVPVYNQERYICECIESILKQTYQNFEIVLVDDNSKDASVSAIKEFIKRDKRIKMILLEENHGAGYARNVGMKYAKGEYLVFLDGDDFFEKDMLEKLYKSSKIYDADVTVCNMYIYDNETKVNSLFDETLDFGFEMIGTPFNMKDIREYAFQFMHEIAWNKMFRHKFLLKTGIKFQEQHNANDQFFVFANLLSAEKIVRLSEPFIHYRINTEGQLSRCIPQKPMCIYNATLATSKFMEQHHYRRYFEKSFNSYIVNRLIFSMDKVDEANREKLFDFYRTEGWKELGMEECQRHHFRNAQSFYQYQIMKREYSEVTYKALWPGIKWNSLSFQELLDKLKSCKYNTVLWGAGKRGKRFLEKAADYEYRVGSIVDKDVEKAGQEFNGYIIKDIRAIKDGDVILITNSLFIKDIKQELNRLKKSCMLIDVQSLLSFEVDMDEAIV